LITIAAAFQNDFSRAERPESIESCQSLKNLKPEAILIQT
jgi:hypothetical protein